MKLCITGSPADRLGELRDVMDFLGTAFCEARELPFDNTALCGAQRVFWAIQEDLRTLETALRDQDSIESSDTTYTTRRNFIADVLSGRPIQQQEPVSNTSGKHPVNGVASAQGDSGEAKTAGKSSRSSKRRFAANPFAARNHRRRICLPS